MKLFACLALAVLCAIPALCQDDDRCRKKVNIGFVLDSSKSMSTRDYEKQKQFVKSLAATFSLSPQTSRAGAIVYSDDAVITARFGQYSYIDEFKRAVDQFYYMGKRTRIDKALKLASETFFTEQAGARSENENIMVILTDGLQTMDPDAVPLREAARSLHENYIRVFAIGVGSHYNRSQLRDIVERDQDLYEADNFDALLRLVKEIARGTCAPAPVVVPKCRYRADIGFVMDASNSIGREDFQKQKDFVNSLAAAFTIGYQETAAGVITYSDEARLVIPLGTHYTIESFQNSVNNIPYTLGRTRIDKALQLANTDLFSIRGRARFDVPHIMVILTDGVQTPDPGAIPLYEAVRPLQQKGVVVLAVGVGSRVDLDELRQMVRYDSDLFSATDFDNLLQKAYEISERTCQDVKEVKLKISEIVILDGGWSSWQQWDTCVPACGGGLQRRNRICNSPLPGPGGRPCEGESRQTRACNQQPCEGQVKCTARVDIGFVMDASRSIGPRDFQKERDFVKAVAGAFNFAPDQTIAGVVLYSTNASLEIPLGQYMSSERFKLAVDQIPHTQGQTRIDKALELTHTGLFARSRPGFPKLMIILTDGVQTTDPDAVPLDQAAAPLHRDGVRVFAVGVGGQINRNELRLMVQRDDDVFYATNFDDLLKKTYQIAKRTCPAVDGGWSSWGQWDSCTQTCGTGSQTRQRVCNNPVPKNGGRQCPGSSRDTRYCNQQSCSVDGNWSFWSPWSSCNRNCGRGQSSRTRACNNPPPRYGGKQCYGRSTETRYCNEQPCAIHGGWSSWSDYDTCTPECGGGRQTRRRTCDNPVRRYDGQPCLGSAAESRACNTQPCPVKCTARADIGFVMDASKSIGPRDFEKQRDFVKSVADSFTFAPDQTIAGVVSYSTNASLEIPLGQYMSSERFKLAVDRIPKSDGQTRIDKALKLTHTGLFGRSRPGFPKLMIILTDGVQTTDPDAVPLDQAAAPLHRDGVRVFAVGVGGQINRYELRLMVQRDDDVFTVTNFDDLLQKTFGIAQRTCESVERKVHGEWSSWGQWDKCLPACGGGRQLRKRSCSSPAPRNGGHDCPGKSTETRICNQQPCPIKLKQCTARVDLGFLMDASNSIAETNFQKQKDFVKGVANSFVFAKDQAMAGVITYSTNAHLSIPLGKYLSVEDFKLAVDNIPYILGQTRIDKALKSAHNNLFSRRVGIRSGFPKVMIILTDGVQTQDPDAVPLNKAVIPLRQNGVKIFAIGVGPYIKEDELRLMVESPGDVFTVKDFDELLQKTYIIAQRTCKRVEEPAPPKIRYPSWSQWQDWDRCIPECGGGRQSRRRVCKNGYAGQCPGLTSESRACNQQPCNKIACSARADIAFLMDDSGSIGLEDFQKERDFVKAVAASFTFARDQTLAAVIRYNSKAYLEIPLGRHLSSDAFRLRTDQIPYTLGQTRIDKALQMATTKIFTAEGGSRPGFPKILIILTDGVQTKDPDIVPLDEAIKPLRRAGVFVIAVGIGGHVDRRELRQMVLRSSDVYTVTDFDDLLKKAYVIAKRTCDVIKTRPRVNGQWSSWSGWSACSVTCDRGIQSRKRSCDNPLPSNGGYLCRGLKKEIRYCNTRRCSDLPRGRWSSWSAWQPCSASCNAGRKYRSRYCSGPSGSSDPRNCVGNSQESQFCSLGPCIGGIGIDGGWSRWTVWTQCPRTCGGGRQYRSRSCTNPAPSNGGNNCGGRSRESRVCATRPCTVQGVKVNGGWTRWTGWTRCTRTCGGGRQYRSRSCTNPAPSNGGNNCGGRSRESRVCATRLCTVQGVKVNGGWTRWTGWTRCPRTCGGGRQIRLRYCTNPAPSNGGFVCGGRSRESRACNTRPCSVQGLAVNGGWSRWSVWTQCPRTCGGAKQYRSRSCTNPAPSNGGYNCGGRSRESRVCATASCLSVPVNGGWTKWNDWTQCTRTCGGGRQYRSRSCTNPAPSNRGFYCGGGSQESRVCATTPCLGVPVNGGWTKWNDWTRCTRTCGGGRQYRSRSCTNPAPSNRGYYCSGGSQESRVCATTPCLVPVTRGNCRTLNGEVLFLLTSSRDIGVSNFNKQLTFVKQMAISYDVSPQGTKFGIVSYGDNAKVHAKFGDFWILKDLSTAIDGIGYLPGQRRVDKALRVASKTFFPSNGIVSYNVPRMIILLTNGRQTKDYDSIPLSRAVIPLRIAKVKIFAIGVGPSVDIRELQVLAESNREIFRVRDFDDLVTRQGDFVRKTCSIFPPKPPPVCLGATDLAFVLDSSGSIGAVNFEKQRQFVKAMSSSFTVGSLATNVGVITYESFAYINFLFSDYFSLGQIRKAVANIPYTGGESRLNLAMDVAVDELFTVGGGARWNIPKVVVVLTDGIEDDVSQIKKSFDKLRHAGIKVILIGVGGQVNVNKLRRLIESENDLVQVSNFNDLLSRAHAIALRTCNDVRGPFPPSQGKNTCPNHMDIAFALDASSEIGLSNYIKQKRFIKAIASHIGFSPYGSRMGVLVYGDTSLIEIRLDHYPNANNFNGKIDQLPYYSQRRRIGKALATANLMYKSARNGANSPGSKVLVFIAAGRRTKTADGKPLWQEVAPLKKAGVKIIAIGIGSDIILRNQLQILTGYRNVFMLPSYDVLLKQIRNFKMIICEAGAPQITRRQG